ncbi:MAG: YqhA family protein [Kiritimatiellae bacterium]|nr:YqhA family protein [Kiritimatiellia bacterium]
MSKLEKCFEKFLWQSRFIVLLSVIFSLISAAAVFVVGSIDIAVLLKQAIVGELSSSAYLVAGIIGSIDLYLIGVVLLIFSFGIYELFISQIDIGRSDKEVRVLEIKTLDDLKNRIIKVVIMVLVVTFFKQVLATDYDTPLDMLYFAASIFAISFGVYFMHKAH